MQNAVLALDRLAPTAALQLRAVTRPSRPDSTPPAAHPTAAGTAGGKQPSRIDPRLLELYRPQLLRYASAILRNQAEAEDAVQETLLAALQSTSFAARSSVRTWLVGILKHKITDALRQRSRVVHLQDVEDVDAFEDAFTEDGAWRTPPSQWNDPESALTQRQFYEVLERCIGNLSRNTAQVFVMRDVMGMDTAQICAALGITSNNCFVMLHRARIKLREQLEQLWFAGKAPEGE